MSSRTTTTILIGKRRREKSTWFTRPRLQSPALLRIILPILPLLPVTLTPQCKIRLPRSLATRRRPALPGKAPSTSSSAGLRQRFETNETRIVVRVMGECPVFQSMLRQLKLGCTQVRFIFSLQLFSILRGSLDFGYSGKGVYCSYFLLSDMGFED